MSDRIELSWEELANDCEMSLGPVDFSRDNGHWSWGQFGHHEVIGDRWFVSYTPSLYPDEPERVYILPAFIGEMIKTTQRNAVEELQQKIRSNLGIR